MSSSSPRTIMSSSRCGGTPIGAFFRAITSATGSAAWRSATRAATTTGAAKMLLADVHMTRKNYQAAAAELGDLLTMGYSLLPSYQAVFDPVNKNNAESIFEVQYSAALEGEASEFIYRFAPFNSGNAIV